MRPRSPTKPEAEALLRLRAMRGVFRSAETRRLGIPSRTLRRLRDLGHVDQLSRGVYRLAALPSPSDPDLLIVAARLPQAVLCLVSALAFHGLTDEIPHQVHIALPRGAEQPRLEHPPLHVVRLREASFRAGIEVHRRDGVDLRVYAATKTVADCFRFRAQVGLETAMKALKALRQRRGFDPEELLGFARICRVERTVRPYLEALL
jgi:predicted transcriptional regulator of viral defense system